MSKQIVAQTASVQSNTKSSHYVEDSVSKEENIQNEVVQSETAESSKTLQLLKEWKVVSYMIQKGQETYKTVKNSSKITESGLDATEKVFSTLTGYSTGVIDKVKPALRLVDNTASHALERLQKSFPAVKESPEKVYDRVVERMGNVVTPAVNTAVAITEIGREQVKKAARKIAESSR